MHFSQTNSYRNGLTKAKNLFINSYKGKRKAYFQSKKPFISVCCLFVFNL